MAVGIHTDSANISGVNVVEQGSDLAAPASGHGLIYLKAGGIYVRRSTGSPVHAGSGAPLTTSRLAVGDGSGLLSALTAGATGAVPTRQADGTISEVVPSSGGGDLTLIDQHIVGAGGEATFTFSAIPSTYQTLEIVYQARSDRAAQYFDHLVARLNADSAGNYGSISQAWNGVSTYNTLQGYTDTWMYAGLLAAALADSGAAASGEILFPAYKRTVFHKQLVSISSLVAADTSSGAYSGKVAGAWASTAAISSITFLTANAATILEGSAFYLYGRS